jgi:hypothetical protein
MKLLKPFLSPNREQILGSFNEKDRETLETFDEQHLIPPQQIEKLNQNSNGLFVGTMKRDGRPKGLVALKEVELSPVNCSQLVKLFRRKESIKKDGDKTWVYPRGITATSRQSSVFGGNVKPGPFFLVLDWPGIKHTVSLTDFLRQYQLPVDAIYRFIHDTVKCVDVMVNEKLLNKAIWNLTKYHLYVEEGGKIRAVFYALEEDIRRWMLPGSPAEDASLDYKVVYNLGLIFETILEQYPSLLHLQAIKSACLTQDTRIKLDVLVNEIDKTFPVKTGHFRKGKYRNQIPKHDVTEHANAWQVTLAEPISECDIAGIHGTTAEASTNNETNAGNTQNQSDFSKPYISNQTYV